jgi:hypothetical protein
VQHHSAAAEQQCPSVARHHTILYDIPLWYPQSTHLTAQGSMISHGAGYKKGWRSSAGGGKSTLARRLADLIRLALHTVDMIKFKAGGEAVPHDECVKIPADLIHRDEWIIDGFGCMASAWERFSATDTLIYVNPGASSGSSQAPRAGQRTVHCGAAPSAAIASSRVAIVTSLPDTGSSSSTQQHQNGFTTCGPLRKSRFLW